MITAYKELLEQRLRLQQQLEPIHAAIALLEQEALESLSAGKPVQGFQLKNGRKSRKVKDEQALVKAVNDLGMTRSSLYDAKLKGVPALEKLFAQTFTKEVSEALYVENIEVTEGKPSIEYTGE